MFELEKLEYYSRYILLERLHACIININELDGQYVQVHDADKATFDRILAELDRRLINIAFSEDEKALMDYDEYVSRIIDGAYECLPSTVR